MSGRTLIAGIGNVFLGDDGFGVEVARRLAQRRDTDPLGWSPDVEVADFGIRALHLAYHLLEGFEVLVLADAMDMGMAAGTLKVIEVDPSERSRLGFATASSPGLDGHTMSPAAVLAAIGHLGGHLDRVYVVGCQPGLLGESMSLSAPVTAALGQACEECLRLAWQTRMRVEGCPSRGNSNSRKGPEWHGSP